MANRWRGEVSIVIDGVPHTAKLTLGALAELEECLGEVSLMDVVERFENSRFTARDVIALLGAGLRGGGNSISDQTLATAEIEGGPIGAARIAAELLARAFVVPE